MPMYYQPPKIKLTKDHIDLMRIVYAESIKGYWCLISENQESFAKDLYPLLITEYSSFNTKMCLITDTKEAEKYLKRKKNS